MDKANSEEPVAVEETVTKREWSKPELTAFAPVEAAEGISFRPNDGLSNLS